ncbi:DNA-directed RNA polymerase subunit omega [Rhizobium laguerreae]|nr:DNA-directed RNA polymerase subunit omega [Rhizobium laguerreae]
MNPSIVFDCEKILPNRFALAMAAAARSRALHRGAEPRLDPSDACDSELALREIARGSFTSSELAPFLGGPAGTKRLHSPRSGHSPSRQRREAAAAPVSTPPEAVQ